MCARFVMALFVFAILFAVGCQRTPEAAHGSHEADVKALRDVEIAEEQAWSSKDLEKTLSFYADDATLMYPNMPSIVGKDNIKAYMKTSFADSALTLQYQITGVDVAQSGDLGYTKGTLTYTMTDPRTGKPTNDRGKMLTVRRKESDGSWKIVQDTFSSDLPLPIEGK
jgi:uncharacterized protein (TIGR02246 family)